MQCYIEKKEFKTAVQWLQQAAKVPVNGIDVRVQLSRFLTFALAKNIPMLQKPVLFTLMWGLFSTLSSKAQIPLDLSCHTTRSCRTTCRTTCLRLVGDQVADKSETRSPTLFVEKKSETRSPTFFVEKKSETKSPTFLSKTCHRLVCDQVPDFFICRKLAARSISTCRDRSILSETRSPTFFLLKTCRRPGFKQVLSKIDVMEFGHYQARSGSNLQIPPKLTPTCCIILH